ncbi:N-acetylmuramoyl-L-alanine amidase family protein [Opitutus terrae]|uniref:N-acetylmuramoyl-L-alanine amidase n=1 Tax=Opitutus terrae (strain DSM 11246 / JCM 15787 / PB90-1) TaxID=452637 RepID=B1ZQS0_OPITP|nr:N-acetylmuramoyl-L-alanine amidase [Opitutus terrae]ACB77821.1 N-acetylmuramoyl-L-alanine amidase [Opitutus terrae PB90-1]
MPAAARRILLGLAVAVGISSDLHPAGGVRAAPTRPGATAAPAPRGSAPTTSVATVSRQKPPPAPATKRARTVPTVGLASAAAKLGLKLSVDRPGRMIELTDGSRRMELELDSRETKINGLRFFLGEPVTSKGGGFQISHTDYESCLVPLLKPALAPNRPPEPKIIALDPGHGGSDTGTQNPRLGLQEKMFTLDVVLRLKKLLEFRGYTVVLTRDADEKVDLPQRAIIANRAQADLFVSVHFNSLYPDTKTSGAEVFTFTRAGQRSDQSRGFGQEDDTEDDPAPVNRYDVWSVALAQALHRETIEGLQLPDRGHKTKHLGMLRGLQCPAALVESGFLSNDAEAKKISTEAYRQKIAEVLASGIERYASVVRTLRRK